MSAIPTVGIRPSNTEIIDGLRGRFGELVCEVGELVPEWNDSKTSDGRVIRKLKSISYGGQTYGCTHRFVHSLSSRFGFSNSIFTLFTPAEVFERIQMTNTQTNIRIVTFGNKCIAASNPRKAYVDYDLLASILTRKIHRIEKVRHVSGEIHSVHRMDDTWDINGDKFTQMFFLTTPIDGYGLPTIHLALRREASGAFLIAGGRVFKSEIQLGKHTDRPEIPLQRAIDTFNNEEGFQSMRQRIESAQTSWASLNEVNGLYRALTQATHQNSGWWSSVYENLIKLSGRVDQRYGIASAESVSVKKARLLPMQCSVADLVYLAIEVDSSNRADVLPEKISRWVGNLLANEYDLEGTKDDGVTVGGNYMAELNKVDSPFIIGGREDGGTET